MFVLRTCQLDKPHKDCKSILFVVCASNGSHLSDCSRREVWRGGFLLRAAPCFVAKTFLPIHFSNYLFIILFY